MIIDLSGIRINKGSLIDDIIFEARMKGHRLNGRKMAGIISALSVMLINDQAFASNIHSKEIIDQMNSSGNFIEAVIFGMIPAMQLQISDVKAIKTYIKSKKSA